MKLIIVNDHTVIEILKTFLATPFEGGRHQKRVDKVPVDH